MFQENLLKGKRILVTGGGTGLGKVMSEAYLKLGAEIVICSRRANVLADTAKELMDRNGGSVKTYPIDIRVADAVDEMIGEIWPLDGLVNNAAGNFICPTKDLSRAALMRLRTLCFTGRFM